MGVLARKIRDGRGVDRELYGTGYGLAGATDPEVLPAGALRRVRDTLWTTAVTRVGDLPGYVGAAFLPGMIILGANWIFTGHWWPRNTAAGFLVGISPPLGICMYLALNRRGFRRFRARNVAGAMLGVGHCPGCGYDLTRATPEDDGCTVCAECGGAWRLPRGDEQREGG
jgi:hypothetical protein